MEQTLWKYFWNLIGLDQLEEKDVPGKPILYATTDDFLNHFNIQKLSDLPTIEELSSAGLIDSSVVDSTVFGTGKFYKEQVSSKKEDIYSDIEKAIDQAPKLKNKHIYLFKIIVYKQLL